MEHWFSQLRCIRIPWGLVNHLADQWWVPECLIQWVWSGARELAFLISSQVMFLLLAWEPQEEKTVSEEGKVATEKEKQY